MRGSCWCAWACNDEWRLWAGDAVQVASRLRACGWIWDAIQQLCNGGQIPYTLSRMLLTVDTRDATLVARQVEEDYRVMYPDGGGLFVQKA